ncbi:MAG: hypothetical protein SF029_11045 [bacterium]|nr:hypothetical protein [bacterium]
MANSQANQHNPLPAPDALAAKRDALMNGLLVGLSLGLVGLWLLLWQMDVVVRLPTPFGSVNLMLALFAGYGCVLGLKAAGEAGLRTIDLLHGALIVGSILCVLRILIFVMARVPDQSLIWDDSVMFYRYVHNMREHGVIAWNAEQGAVYGSTELLYLFLVWALSWFTGANAPHLTLTLAGTLSGMAFFGLVILAGWRLTRGSITVKLGVVFVLLVGLMAHYPSLGQHFLTGMGTTFVMGWLLGYLLLAHWFSQSPTRSNLIITALVGGFTYYARPDLALFGALVPLALLIFSRGANRRWALWLVVATGAVGAACVGVAWLYFGSPVPLSFFVKSTTDLYGASDIYSYRDWIAAEQFPIYARNSLFLLAISALGLLRPRACFRRVGAVGIGAALAAIVFIIYYNVIVLQIMYMFQRFYYPTLPVLVYLALCSLQTLLEGDWMPGLARRYARRGIDLPQALAWTTAGALLLIALPWQPFIQDMNAAAQPRQLFYQPPPHEYNWRYSFNWFALHHYAEIDHLVVASTEVGAPSIANYTWYIHDLSGLNDEREAFNGFSVDYFLNEVQPDLIYMPFYPDYREMIDQLRAHPGFSEGYDYLDRTATNANLSFAIRRSSSHYTQLRAIAEQWAPAAFEN